MKIYVELEISYLFVLETFLYMKLISIFNEHALCANWKHALLLYRILIN